MTTHDKYDDYSSPHRPLERGDERNVCRSIDSALCVDGKNKSNSAIDFEKESDCPTQHRQPFCLPMPLPNEELMGVLLLQRKQSTTHSQTTVFEEGFVFLVVTLTCARCSKTEVR